MVFFFFWNRACYSLNAQTLSTQDGCKSCFCGFSYPLDDVLFIHFGAAHSQAARWALPGHAGTCIWQTHYPSLTPSACRTYETTRMCAGSVTLSPSSFQPITLVDCDTADARSWLAFAILDSLSRGIRTVRLPDLLRADGSPCQTYYDFALFALLSPAGRLHHHYTVHTGECVIVDLYKKQLWTSKTSQLPITMVNGHTIRTHVCLTLPPLGHVLRRKCVATWFEEHDSCPVCRALLQPKALVMIRELHWKYDRWHGKNGKIHTLVHRKSLNASA